LVLELHSLKCKLNEKTQWWVIGSYMTYERETLKLLRLSLDQEEDETSIIPILQNHHKYIKEYLNILSNPDAEPIDKQNTVSLFFSIFGMHAKSESETLYQAFKQSGHHEVRTVGFKNSDDNDLVFELIDELRDLDCETSWTEAVDDKMRVLNGLLQLHVKEEENVMFQMAEKYLPESTLIDLAEDYLDYCKLHLDTHTRLERISPEVSRSDVMAFT
jgi:hemerythrin-like domain-containing protein